VKAILTKYGALFWSIFINTTILLAHFIGRCRLSHLKRYPNYYTWTLYAQNDEIDDSTEFLQPYPVVESDTLLEIGTAVISEVLSLDDHL
jgi:hypothetical protein